MIRAASVHASAERQGAPSRGLMTMLTRDQLTDDQWRTVRNTPHHVVIAVSAVGGSILDEMLERAAAMAGIVDALNSRHPLVQGIGASADIMAAQEQVRRWYHGLEDSERHAANLQAKALAMFQDAVCDAPGARPARRRTPLLRFRHLAGAARGAYGARRRRVRHRRRAGEQRRAHLHRAARGRDHR